MHTLAYGRGTLGRSPCFVYYAERGVVACHNHINECENDAHT